VKEEGEEGGRFRFSVTQGEEGIMFACGSDDARMQFIVAIEAAAESPAEELLPPAAAAIVEAGVQRRLSAVREIEDN
jgi:hypothetical protein